MAFREIRFYIQTGDKEEDRRFAIEIYQPFTWYMDTLMRGRFKEYSGDEVKGINIVNLCLYSKSRLEEMQKISGGKLKLNEWIPMLNTLQLESEIDTSVFAGGQTENIVKSLEIFITYAKKSDLPQMITLVNHLLASIGSQSVDAAIEKANKYLEKLYRK